MQRDDFETETTKEDHELAYSFDNKVVVEFRRSLEKISISSLKDKVNKNKSTSTFHYILFHP